ncbi:MAG: tetratricopeptide repeat protein [Deltaproteobacteria bacterium]|nr:tetratricopeptide repeat protein [Deltaproteobacteria bacterium]
MDILEPILTLIPKNLLDIITILWIIWFAGLALGLVVSTVYSCRNRRTLARLSQRYEQAKRRRDEGAIQFELDPERIKNTLLCREAELSGDAERMGLDFGILGVLEDFRGRIQQRLADLPATHHELLDRLQNIYVALDVFKDLCGPDQLSLARMALQRGSTGKAAALLKRAQSLGNQHAAEASGSQLAVARNKRLTAGAAFFLGQLAEIDFDYFTATQYYQLAADLQPSNLTYLKAAAELSYAFEEFHETGQLLEQVLKIQERLLGPEHLDLAQTLNNLGVLRHTQGRHAEAEAFYLWALEICEAQRYPQDQDAVNLMQNYAAFLQEVGRHHEADEVKARTAMA